MAKFYQLANGEIAIITNEGAEYLEGAALITRRYGHENVVLIDPRHIPIAERDELMLVSSGLVRVRTGVLDRLEVARRLKDGMVDPANFSTPKDLHTCEVQNGTIRGIAHALGVLEEFDALIEAE